MSMEESHSDRPGAVVDGRKNVISFEVGTVVEDRFNRHPGSQKIQQHLDRVSEPAHCRLAMADGGVDGDPVQARHQLPVRSDDTRRVHAGGQSTSRSAVAVSPLVLVISTPVAVARVSLSSRFGVPIQVSSPGSRRSFGLMLSTS